jgi:uncharacterized RDD family membrane protein YckC
MNAVGIGTRVFAFLIDGIIVFILTYIAYRTWSWYAFYYKIKYFQFYYFWFVVIFFYYLFCEGIWRRTPGKWASLSKVVGNEGKKASFGQILVRAFIRALGVVVIDSLLLPFKGRTFHDYLSKTYVIEV